MSEIRALGAWQNAVNSLNTKGIENAMGAYGSLQSMAQTEEEKKARTEVLKQLKPIGRALYTIAAVQDYVTRAKLQTNKFIMGFGGVRTMFAFEAKKTFYLIAVDVTVDPNGGTVVTQWITRQPVSQQNIARLISGKQPQLLEKELSGDHFEKYSEINAISGTMRRTVENMEKAVLSRLTEKIKQMRG